MSSLKDLQEKLQRELFSEEDEPASKLRSREYRDTVGAGYKGRVSGTSDVEINYEELADKLNNNKKTSFINWVPRKVRFVANVITDYIGVTPMDDEDYEDYDSEEFGSEETKE